MARAEACAQWPECGNNSLLDFLRQLAECAIISDTTGLQGINVVQDSGTANDTTVYECAGVDPTKWEAVLNGCFVQDQYGRKALQIFYTSCNSPE